MLKPCSSFWHFLGPGQIWAYFNRAFQFSAIYRVEVKIDYIGGREI